MKQERLTSANSGELYSRFLKIHEAEKNKLPKTEKERFWGKVKAASLGVAGLVFGAAIGSTANPVLGLAIIGFTAIKTHEAYYPEEYCYVKAIDKLKKELKIDEENKSIFQDINGLFSKKDPKIASMRKEFNEMFRGDNKGFFRPMQCPHDLKEKLLRHNLSSDFEDLLSKSSDSNSVTREADRFDVKSQSMDAVKGEIEVVSGLNLSEEDPAIKGLRDEIASATMKNLFEGKTLTLEEKALKSVACETPQNAEEVANQMVKFCEDLGVSCSREVGAGGSQNLKVTMPEGWKGKSEPFTMNENELKALQAEIAKQNESKQEGYKTSDSEKTELGKHALAVRRGQEKSKEKEISR